MKKYLIFILFNLVVSLSAIAQNQWVSYHATVPTKAYEGRKFKLSALVRTEPKDSTAKAQLWARVDKTTGRGFFNSMADRPIRNAEWKTYSIEGKIDSASTQIAFGILAFEAGTFFLDDIRLSIEMQDGTWQNIYENDFENGQVGLKQGKVTSRTDSLFKAMVIQTDKNKYLKIEASSAFDFYQNELLTQKEDTNKVNLLYKIGDLYAAKKDIKKATAFNDKALALSQKIGFTGGQIRYHYTMALLHRVDWKRRIEHNKKGLEYAQNIGLRQYTGSFAFQISNAYLEDGNYSEALKYAYMALKEYELLNNKYWASECYNLVAFCMDNQKNITDALNNRHKALKLREELDDKRLIAQSYADIGATYLDLSKLDSAQYFVLKSIELYDKIDKSANYGFDQLARIYLKKGEANEQKGDNVAAQSDFKEALKYYEKVQKIYQQNYLLSAANMMNISIGIVYFKLRNINLSNSFLIAGVNSKEFLFKEDRRDAYLYLFKIDSIRGNWKEANTNYRKHILYRDSLFNEESTKKTTMYQMQYEFDLKEAATKAEQDKKELALQKEIELKALAYEYEKKQAAAKTEKEKQQLQYEQQLKQQQIEAQYAQKVVQIEAEQKRKIAIAKIEQEKREALNASALALSQAEVRRKEQESTYFMLGLGLLTVLLGFIVYGYFQKQKANTLLQTQKEEIDHKSRQLEKSLTELTATQNQLIQKEKLASLGELTAGIAHEIQNPLNFVNNFSEMSVELLEELKSPLTPDGGIRAGEKVDMDLFDDVVQNLSKINHHGKRASSIVSGMLEHSRTSTGERVMTDINKLADEYLRLSYHGMKAKNRNGLTGQFDADYELIADENLPLINVVPQDIGRVLLNLINNAFYAAWHGAKGGEHGVKVGVTTKTIDNQIIITVSDNGAGIPDTIKSKIFQPFFTTKPTGEGTGLGLSLSYDIVTKGHNGTLEVETKEGEGTTFVVKLPIV